MSHSTGKMFLNRIDDVVLFKLAVRHQPLEAGTEI